MTQLTRIFNNLIGAPEGGYYLDHNDRSSRTKPPIPVRHTPGSGRVKIHTLDKELPSTNNKKATRPVLYHSMGPNTSLAKETNLHVYTDDPVDHVYQYADAGLQCHSESTIDAAQVSNTYMSLSTMKSLHSLFQQLVAHEIQREELFDTAGSYVPTSVSIMAISN